MASQSASTALLATSVQAAGGLRPSVAQAASRPPLGWKSVISVRPAAIRRAGVRQAATIAPWVASASKERALLGSALLAATALSPRRRRRRIALGALLATRAQLVASTLLHATLAATRLGMRACAPVVRQAHISQALAARPASLATQDLTASCSRECSLPAHPAASPLSLGRAAARTASLVSISRRAARQAAMSVRGEATARSARARRCNARRAATATRLAPSRRLSARRVQQAHPVLLALLNRRCASPVP